MRTFLSGVLLIIFIQMLICDNAYTSNSPVVDFIKHPLSPSSPSVLGGAKYSTPFAWMWQEYKVLSVVSIVAVLTSLLANVYLSLVYFGYVRGRTQTRIIVGTADQALM
jgi:hypothetical protein